MYLPFIDLHLHFDGSISVPMARVLSRMDDGVVDALSDEEIYDFLCAGDSCGDLNLYLSKFNVPLSLLQMPEQMSECVYLLQEELKAQGYAYAELRFAPQSHHERGMTQRDAVEAALDGLRRSDFDARLILCCMRGNGNDGANRETIRLAGAYLGQGVVAADLAGAEALYPTSNYGELFAYARRLGVPFTIHAGEAAGPHSVWSALSFGAMRIGHGVRSVEDPRLVEELVKRGVTLEVCPTSEVQTGLFASVDRMPVRDLLNSGVNVVVCSDNMMVSHTTVEREFELLRAGHGLSEDEVRRLQLNAIDAAFADETTKQCLRSAMLNP